MGVEYTHYVVPRDRDHRPSVARLLQLVAALRRERWVVDPGSPRFATMIATLAERYAEDERVGLWEPSRGLGRLFPWWRRPRATTAFGHDYHRPFGDAKGSGAYARTVAPAAVHGRLPAETALREDWLAAHEPEPVRLLWPVPSLALSGLRYPVRPRPYEERQADRVWYTVELHWSDDFVYHTSEIIEPFAESPACASCGARLEFDPVGAWPEPPLLDAAIHRICPRCGSPFRPDGLVVTVRDPMTGGERAVAGGAAYRFAFVVDCGKWVPDGTNGGVHLEEDLLTLCRATLDTDLVEISDGSF